MGLRAGPSLGVVAAAPRRAGARAAWLAIALLGCGEPPEAPPVASPSDHTPAEPVAAAVPKVTSPGGLPEAALQRITPQRLREHVEWLAADRLRGRPTPSPELDEAAEYLRARLSELGLTAPKGAPEHLQRFDCGQPTRPGDASNVVGLLPGRDPELGAQTVLVSAHYDHIGTRDLGEADGIFNGANDNATGTAAVLAIAEALVDAPPRRSVLFVAFCGEEHGMRGSYHFADHPLRPLEDVVAHVNIEMLGRPSPAEPPVVWLPGMARSELGSWLAAANPGSGVRFVDAREIGPEEGEAFDRSDNYPLALRGVVAHTVSTGTIDDLYHSPRDESDTIDYPRMAVLVQAVARGVHRLAEHDGRPAWIDPPR